MKLTNRQYDVLKWLVLIAIPASAVAYNGLALIWGWPYAEAVAQTANIICTLLGSLIGISTINYNNNLH